MSDDTPQYQAHPTAAFQDVDSEVFVVTEDNRLHNLRDEVAVVIWQELERQPTDMANLVQTITSQFDVEPTTAQTDIETFLEEALKKKLIVEVEKATVSTEEP